MANPVKLSNTIPDHMVPPVDDSGLMHRAWYQYLHHVVDHGLIPEFDNKYTIGRPGLRWQAVFSVNGVLQTSDPAQKDEIAYLPNDMMDIVAAINPITFCWSNSADLTTHWGFDSSNVKSVFDASDCGVTFGGYIDERGIQYLNYSELLPILWKAVQEVSVKQGAQTVPSENVMTQAWVGGSPVVGVYSSNTFAPLPGIPFNVSYYLDAGATFSTTTAINLERQFLGESNWRPTHPLLPLPTAPLPYMQAATISAGEFTFTEYEMGVSYRLRVIPSAGDFSNAKILNVRFGQFA